MTSSPRPTHLRLLMPIALVLLFLAADALRVGVALWLVRRNEASGVEHELADSELYWKLAQRIAAGEPYDDGKRQVLRTPGYPVFLAASIRLFGLSITAARHAQAAVGAASCVLLFFLVRRLVGERAAWLAAGAAALYPFAVFLSAVLLSEALFAFVLLVHLLLLAPLVDGGAAMNRLCATAAAGRSSFGATASSTEGQDSQPASAGTESAGRLENGLTTISAKGAELWRAVLVGVSGAVVTLVRPSWILAGPLVAVFVLFARRLVLSTQYSVLGSPHSPRERGPSSVASPRDMWRFAIATVILVAFAAGMLPWWIRNGRVTGHFVPTTLWVGASLYDGWNERATGASNMEFMNRPREFGLDERLHEMSELEQDEYLRGEAWRFAGSHPWRVVELAVIKFGRFWKPLPNAAEWRSGWLRLMSVVTCGPVLVLALVGAWRLRRRWRVLVLLAGPVLYFCVIHLVFVSSIRYREAAMLPMLGLAAAAVAGSDRESRHLEPLDE